MSEEPEVGPRIAGSTGVCGELVLRRAGADFEIIANGVFLMDTRNGESERLMVAAAADRMRGRRARCSSAGLGVGFSLRAALDHPRVGEVVVVERERAVIDWNRGPLRVAARRRAGRPAGAVRARPTCSPGCRRRRRSTASASTSTMVRNGPSPTGTRRCTDDSGLDDAGRRAGARAGCSRCGAPARARRSPRGSRNGSATWRRSRVPVPRGEPDRGLPRKSGPVIRSKSGLR